VMIPSCRFDCQIADPWWERTSDQGNSDQGNVVFTRNRGVRRGAKIIL
jgi:hypothetical protein